MAASAREAVKEITASMLQEGSTTSATVTSLSTAIGEAAAAVREL